MNEKEALQQKRWAVVGANRDREKFGNRIYRRLRERGWEVWPVNPVVDTVEDDRCYPDLTSLPARPDVVCLVVAPARGLGYVEEAARLGVSALWLQPGTWDDALLTRAQALGLATITACVLVATEQG